MKKVLIVAGLAMMLFVIGTVKPAHAMYMDPVTFYVVDDDTNSNDDSVTLSFSYIAWSNTIKLQYSVDNSSWSDVGTSLTVAASNWQQIYLRLANNSDGSVFATGGDVSFSGPENGSAGLYNSVFVIWSSSVLASGGITASDISVGTANDDDNIGAVPVPAAIWLLGSGLLGLGIFRRRTRK